MIKIYTFTSLLLISLFSISFHSDAQNSPTYVNQEAFDRSGSTMLLGRTSISGLSRMPYQTWFDKGQAEYEPDTNVLNELKPFIKDLSFKIYAATWCGDTRRELPHFVKILRGLSTKSKQYEMYMVDNHAEAYKQAPEKTIYGESIFRVATFIVERDGKEIGRIIERPVESLEKDLLKIVSGKPYEPSYNLVPRLQNLVSERGSFYVINNVEKIAGEVQGFKSKASEINAYAYTLLAQQRSDLALAVLKINAYLFPKQGSVHDYMADVFLKNGNVKEAITSYKKMLELEPESTYAKSMIEKYNNQ